MGKIVVLDEATTNKIAAGEVIERPASVVKELVENSIDSGAASISVEIRNGGISYIKVNDNGSGIMRDDAELAFERHATSKIRSSGDIEKIKSMGFRGEALASIAAVSKVTLVTRVLDNIEGTSVSINGGTFQDVTTTGCPVGTTVIVRDLFYNTPARFKFLKKDTTEAGYVSDIVSRLALANPQISFTMISNGSEVFRTPEGSDHLNTISGIYGFQLTKSLAKVDYKDNTGSIKGYIGRPELSRSTRSQQSIFVNNRYVKNKTVTSALDHAFTTYLMKNRYAFAVLNIDMNPGLIDINVHPSKTEIKFANDQDVYRLVFNGIQSSLYENSVIREIATVNEILPKNSFWILENQTGSQPLPDPIQNKASEYKTDNFFLDENSVQANFFGEGVKEQGVTAEQTQDYKFVYVGQAFSTYLIIQQNDSLVLIDQHAAHERLLYEKIRKNYENKTIHSQVLLTGISLDFTHKEILFLEEEQQFFEDLGFHYDLFGNNSLILRSVPNEAGDNPGLVLRNLTEYSLSNLKRNKVALVEEALFMLACKAAVKANMKLDPLEVGNLLLDLQGISNPFTCPHGRPSMFKVSRNDLDKLFKRIV